MSATMTMTFPPITSTQLSTMATTTTTTTTSCCPNCGLSLPSPTNTDAQTALLEAQKQIEDLQAQVRLLNQKATAAVDRWADYEDELSRLRAASMTSAATTQASPPPSSVATSSPRSSFLPTGAAARISQLLTPRKSAPNLAARAANGRGSLSSPHLPPLPTNGHHASVSVGTSVSVDRDLLEELSREKELRARAEGRLNDTSKEVEELSATLFEQANEMVATERRARAKLEERVSVLERRDVEKRDRLERLEGAMGRLDRVKALLGES
ncbi:uncharacterized protein GGS22DRAFT_173229 [Annulohypoxylon maeteangense]|uniref:uncharacterized protein n=1 Tax=Annulohypoxylon maeteangense TaxID=1927788 RepID=UPI0020074277|nr:uncharacterized protein GGS22DRAFT_173229 [Annulohypoxylon maeteangense]KAI0881054.1 hypothetical protein GGS22DRAFT_173229 [Annulohypoxylon maeteangense]